MSVPHHEAVGSVREADAARGHGNRGAPARGHRALVAVLLLLGALAIFVFVARPMVQQQARLERELAQRTAQLAAMREAAWQLRAHMPRVPGGDAQDASVLAVVAHSARAAALGIERMQPEGEHGVRISFEEIGFDVLIAWLAELEAGHGLRARTLQLERAERPGRVAGEALLTTRAAQ